MAGRANEKQKTGRLIQLGHLWGIGFFLPRLEIASVEQTSGRRWHWMLLMMDDAYTPDIVELETIEQAAQDYLRLPTAEDSSIAWSRSFQVQ
jgi:hypothetical protein